MKSAAAVNAFLKHVSPFLTLKEKALSDIGTTLGVNASACQILINQRALSGTQIFVTGFAHQLYAKIMSISTSSIVNASARSRSVPLNPSLIQKHASASAFNMKSVLLMNTGTTNSANANAKNKTANHQLYIGTLVLAHAAASQRLAPKTNISTTIDAIATANQSIATLQELEILSYQK